MREIKFRYYDPSIKCMLQPSAVGIYGWYEEDRDFEDGNSQPFDRLMQYTGIKDMNGVEIYEGDICLKHWSKDLFGFRKPIRGLIKWVDFGGRYTHESIASNGHKYYEELYENLTYTEYPRSMFEVIGNIYENPDLINQLNQDERE